MRLLLLSLTRVIYQPLLPSGLPAAINLELSFSVSQTVALSC